MNDLKEQFGWGLLSTLYKESFLSKMHVVVIFTHFVLIKNGFRCIGLGLTNTLYEGSIEILPEDWARYIMISPFYIRYLWYNNIFIIHIEDLNESGHYVVRIFRQSDYTMYMAMIPADQIYLYCGPLNLIIPNWKLFINNFRLALIQPFELEYQNLQGGNNENSN